MKRIDASTLVEIVVALVIMMIIFGLSTLAFVQINRTRTDPALRLHYQMEAIAQELNRLENYTDQQIELENNVYLSVRWLPYASEPGIWALKMEATGTDGKLITTYKELMLKAAE